MNITISCSSCRKCKRTIDIDDASLCRHRKDKFIAIYGKPCSEWLPSKSDIKLILKRNQVEKV